MKTIGSVEGSSMPLQSIAIPAAGGSMPFRAVALRSPRPGRGRRPAAGQGRASERLLFLFFILLLAMPAPAVAQTAPRAGELRISTGVVPDTVTVGDRFQSVLRVEGEFEAIEFFQVAVGDTVQPVDSMQVTGGDSPTAVYTLVAWHTGDDLEASIPFRLVMADGSSDSYEVSLRLPVVASVLPLDTTLHLPRPHRGLMEDPAIGAEVRSWIWLLLLLIPVALLAAWLLRRRRAAAPMPRESPRERALRRLAELERDGSVRPGAYPHLYPAATRVVRDFLAELRPEWGTDLTSTELRAAIASAPSAAHLVASLSEVLAHADAVKFARHRPSDEELRAFWSEVRETVDRFAAAEGADAREEVTA